MNVSYSACAFTTSYFKNDYEFTNCYIHKVRTLDENFISVSRVLIVEANGARCVD